MLKFTKKITRFCLAAFLWMHGLFLFNIRPEWLSQLSTWLHLSSIEVTLFLLLLVFSFVAGKGFWQAIGNILYVYFFPFVLFFYICIFTFYGMRAIVRLTSHNSEQLVNQSQNNLPTVPEQTPTSAVLSSREKINRIGLLLLRPFRRFTILWCFLLLTTTHHWILIATLVLVLLHIARTSVSVLKLNFSSSDWLDAIEKGVQNDIEGWVSKLRAVTRESPAGPDLKSLRVALQFWDRILRFLQDEPVLSRWGLLCGSMFFGSIFIYVAFLFSFAYYGIAESIGFHAISWANFLVMSLFIPFYVSAFPPSVLIRMLAGIQCVLVLAVGISSVVKYVQRRIRVISNKASIIHVKLLDESLREKKLILEEKLSPTSSPASSSEQ